MTEESTISRDYERSYLELLSDYHSEETKKTRRNLTVASFVVIAIHVASVPISKLKFPYVDSGDMNPTAIVILAGFLIFYWSSMLVLYVARDQKVQAERQHQLSNIEDALKKELESLNRRIGNSGQAAFPIEYSRREKLKRDLQVVSAQRTRTTAASWWNSALRNIEYVSAALLAGVALSLLGLDFATAFVQGW